MICLGIILIKFVGGWQKVGEESKKYERECKWFISGYSGFP